MSIATIPLLERERKSHPGVVDLARGLSLATHIEPALIRAMRLELAPGSDPGIESDLWFSPIVQVRSQQGMTLLPAIVTALRTELTFDPDRALTHRAWRVIATVHGIPLGDEGFTRAKVSPVLALEETLTYLATLGTPDALSRIDLLLGRALASVRDRQDRGVARWAVRTLPRLPEALRHSAAALALAAAASATMGGIPVRGVLSATDTTGTWTPEMLASLPTVTIGLRVVATGLEISEPPARGTMPFDLPATLPLVLEVQYPDANGWQTVRVQVGRGTRQIAQVPVGPVLHVGTIRGVANRVVPQFEGGLRAIWLVDGTRQAFDTESRLRDAVGDVGYEVARLNEVPGSPHAVLVWRFASLEDVDETRQRAAKSMLEVRQSGRRPTLVWVGDTFVVPSRRAVELEWREAHDHARTEWDPDSPSEADHQAWTSMLLRDASRLFDNPDERHTATRAHLRSTLLAIDCERAAEWIRAEEAKRYAAATERSTNADVAAPAPAADLVGREDVLAELDRLVSREGGLRSDVIILVGEGGIGKSAIAHGYVASRQNVVTVVEQDVADTADARAVDSAFLLAAHELAERLQLTSAVVAQNGRDAMHQLVEAITSSSKAPGRDRPVVIVVDGLDGPDRDRNPIDVLDSYLPKHLPPGTFVLTTARPRADVDGLDPASMTFGGEIRSRARRVVSNRVMLNRIDLDNERWRASAEAAIRTFWERTATRQLGRETDDWRGERIVERIREAVDFCEGNYRVAEMLERWFQSTSSLQTIPSDVTRGFAGIVDLVRRAILQLSGEARDYATAALPLLAIAREPIPLLELVRFQEPPAAGWPAVLKSALTSLSPLVTAVPDEADRRVALVDRLATVALAGDAPAQGGQSQSPLSLDFRRGHEELLRGIDALLERTTHASPSVQWATAYKMRYGLEHALDGHLLEIAIELCSSPAFLQDLIASRGYQVARDQLDRLERMVASESSQPGPIQSAIRQGTLRGLWARSVQPLATIVRDYGAVLARAPDTLTTIAHDHLRRTGVSSEDVASRFKIDVDALPARLVSPLGSTIKERSDLFIGHTTGVTAIATVYSVSTAQAASPAVVVSGDRSGVLNAWDLRSQRLLWTAAHHGAPVTAVAIGEWAFGPEAIRRGLSGDGTGVLAVWNLRSGAAGATIKAHDAGVVACAMSSDGRWIVSAAEDRSVFVGQLKMSGQSALTIEPVIGEPVGIYQSVACGVWCGEHDVVLVCRDGRIARRRLDKPSKPPLDVSFSGPVRSCSIDRRGLAVVWLEDGTIEAMQLAGAAQRKPSATKGPGASEEIGPCVALDDQVAFGTGETIVLVSSTSTDRRLRGHFDVVRALAREEVNLEGQPASPGTTEPRQDVLVSASDDRTVRLWRGDDGRPLAVLGEFGRPFQLMDVDPVERLAVFPVDPSTLAFHDLRNDVRREPRPFGARITACRFAGRPQWSSPGGSQPRERLLAVGLADGHVMIARGEGPLEAVHPSTSPVTSLVWLEDPVALVATFAGGALAGERQRHVVAVIHLDGDVARHHVLDWPDILGGVIPVGARLFLTVADKGLDLWTTDGRRSSLRTTVEQVSAVATHPASPTVAAGSLDGTVMAWERPTDGEAFKGAGGWEITHLHAPITACMLAPGPDGSAVEELVVCGLADGGIAIMPPRPTATPRHLRAHTKTINGLALFPDGRHAASWSVDGSLRVWDVQTLEVTSTTCSRAPFIDARIGASGRVYALDALGQAWLIEVRGMSAAAAGK